MKKVLTILLVILLSFAVGCTPQEEVIDPPAQMTETNQDAADATEYEEPPVDTVSAEVAWPTYTSVEAMIQAIQAKNMAWSEIGALSTIYVPPQTLSGCQLYLIEVSPYSIHYYYMPGETAAGFSYSEGILVTNHREPEFDPNTFFADNHLIPDEDGFVYEADQNEMTFIQDGGIISIRVPDVLNDYDTLRKLCQVKRIEITEDALAEANWEMVEVEETDGESTEDGPAIVTWDIEPGEKAIYYPSVEGLLQSGYFEPLTTVYTPPSKIEGFSLWNIELSHIGITYYYNPGEAPQDQFDWNRGITYTIFQNGVITFKSVCETSEVVPDEDGFAYDSMRHSIHFEQDGIAVSIHVPEHMNDYDTLRSLCRMEKVTVP